MMKSDDIVASNTSTAPISNGDYAGPPARKKFAIDASSQTAAEIAAGAQKVAEGLQEFLHDKLPLDSTIDLQLAICRKLRELLPNSKEMLHVAQEKNWIPIMLSWLNLHDRPAVQVEALLALTNIAELCAQQSYFQHTAQQTSAVAAAAQAAVSAVKGVQNGNPSLQEAMEVANKYAPSKYPYPSLVAPAPGSVPFPPLSFSQTLSPEAVAAFDASLTSTIQSANAAESRNASSKDKNKSWSMPPAPLFPQAPPLPGAFSTATGAINFTSLAPPPGGPHSSVPSNAFLPPPTPVGNPGGGPSFPQQLSASSQHLLLRHADAIPTLISLLSSPNREVYEQAMWILGSIAAGDSPSAASTGGSSASTALDGRDKSVSARDVILAAGVMNQLLRCLETHSTNLALQRIGSWTLSNLLDGIFQQSAHNNSSNNNGNKNANAVSSSSNSNNNSSSNVSRSGDYSSADEIDMTTLLPVLKRLLHTTDSEVLSYTCWTLSHLCDGPSSHIAAVVTTKDSRAPPGGLVPRLVELLVHPSWRVTKPALRTIGNIVCAECSDDAASTDYTEVILDCGAVPRLKELVTHSNREIQKESCWTLSNIAAGTVDQIQSVIDSGAIPPLVKLVQDKKTDQEVRSEGCWVVLNATSCGSDSQIEILVEEGCVAVLGVLLAEASMVMMALEGLERVLQVEETREIIRREQIENGEIEDDEENRTPTLVTADLIEKAREPHNSSAVIKRADRIWKQHFVSCALCKKSFSRHRTSDASFCEECKCHVCSNCNCRIYHLDYQEELWAATEEKTEAKKNAKKSKKKNKKAKQKKAKQQQEVDIEPILEDTKPMIESTSVLLPPVLDLEPMEEETQEAEVRKDPEAKTFNSSDGLLTDEKKSSPSPSFDEEEEDDETQNQIDFVLYLQQTGSIIALAKLMDALEYGGDDYDEELDDYERRMIREQQILRGQASAASSSA